MIRLGVRMLKDGLTRVLRQVQEGDTVEVTDDGRPIARVIKAWSSRVQQMVAEGRLIPPKQGGDLLDLWPPPPLEPGERLGSEILAELRADER
jgi:prevent-host-death family protein